ncbi:MAG TPA: hypothetical protein ENI92_01105 [Bacteroidetes bacterium]|nr:hypothetical protein [Bacteroidota bacterium]
MAEVPEPKSINTEGQIPGLTVREMIRLATVQVNGVMRRIDRGYAIEIRDYPEDRKMDVMLTRAADVKGGSNLRINIGAVKGQMFNTLVSMNNLEHLYITWETPRQITFCYAAEGRYSLVDISRERGVIFVEDIDRRLEAEEDEERELTPEEEEARRKRRTFYHIGVMLSRDMSTAIPPEEESSGSSDRSAE